MKLILQHNERDCGAACLAMLVAHYGKRLPLSRFCELTRTDRSGASLYGLASSSDLRRGRSPAICRGFCRSCGPGRSAVPLSRTS